MFYIIYEFHTNLPSCLISSLYLDRGGKREKRATTLMISGTLIIYEIVKISIMPNYQKKKKKVIDSEFDSSFSLDKGAAIYTNSITHICSCSPL